MPADFTHHARLVVEDGEGRPVLKDYRWRVEAFDGRQRVVAEHRVVGRPRWSTVRNPDREAKLLARGDADLGSGPGGDLGSGPAADPRPAGEGDP